MKAKANEAREVEFSEYIAKRASRPYEQPQEFAAPDTYNV